MKLLIHDLNEEEWLKVSGNYEGWTVIRDDGTIRPCAGCFGCWTRTPGECVIKDGYDRMPKLISEAEEVVVMSRYTYGGFSSFVKNVMDRSIGYVLPFFEVVGGEMHHRPRYPETKDFTFIFRGKNLTQEDRSKAGRYVSAVCRNLRGNVKGVLFEDLEGDPGPGIKEASAEGTDVVPGRTVLLNCSPRGDKANTKIFLDMVAERLGAPAESVKLTDYRNKEEELVGIIASAEKVVFGMPMYVDNIPSPVLGIMERMEAVRGSGRKKIYVVANMGFYESSQLENLMSSMRTWCETTGFEYCGGLAIGAGEMLGMMAGKMPPDRGPVKNVGAGIARIAAACDEGTAIPDIQVMPSGFPRSLYMLAANMGWPKAAKVNGLKKKDLYRR